MKIQWFLVWLYVCIYVLLDGLMCVQMCASSAPGLLQESYSYSLFKSPVIIGRCLCLISTTSWRRMGKQMHRSTYSWPRHWLEVSGQLHASVALHPRKLDKRTGEEENNHLLVPAVGSQFSVRQARNLVTIPTELLGPDLKVFPWNSDMHRLLWTV
jgi:hypothetical protein